jgi:ABC-type glycerol-3-phosphate transport system permease component
MMWRPTRYIVGAYTIVALFLAPLGWLIIASLRPESLLFAANASAPPAAFTFEHYRALFAERAFLIPIRNSLVIATLTTAIAIPIAAVGAYALARLPIRGKMTWLGLLLAISTFPQISVIAPLFLALRELRLIDTYAGVVLPHVAFATPLAVWLLTTFFRQLPRELEEAAMMDGASRLRVLRDVVLPLAAPGLASTAILTFLFSWNEFLFALSFTLGPDRQTVPVAIALFRGRYQVPWGQVLAAAVIASAPVALMVLAFQRRIVAGLTAGAVKG